jgi:hypothetical protein
MTFTTSVNAIKLFFPLTLKPTKNKLERFASGEYVELGLTRDRLQYGRKLSPV